MSFLSIGTVAIRLLWTVPVLKMSFLSIGTVAILLLWTVPILKKDIIYLWSDFPAPSRDRLCLF